MADTPASKSLTPEQWDSQFFVEVIAQNRFMSSMGSNENAIIQVKEQLGVKPGDAIHYALVNRLTEEGVENGATLEDNEEVLDTRGYRQTIKERAHGVRSNRWEAQLSAIDLRKAAKMALKMWAMENTRDRIIAAMGMVGGFNYDVASDAVKNQWHADNSDRILYGKLLANAAGNSHSAALARLSIADDKFTTSMASQLKRMARTCSPKIRAVSSGPENRFFYTCYVPSIVMRDLKNDPVIQQAQRDVTLRMQNIKLFKGGDVEWDGIIFKEIEDIKPLGLVGKSVDSVKTQVSPVYFCGAQAVAYAVAERWKSAEEAFDYGRKKGCAIMEMGGFGKIRFGTGEIDPTTRDDLLIPKDHGMVTCFVASEADK